MLDSYSSKILDQYQDTLHKRQAKGDSEDSMDEDELLEMLEKDAPTHLYEQRAQELAHQMDQARRNIEQGDYGKLIEVDTEQKVFDISTNGDAKRVVVHFYHPDFQRCKIMRKKLQSLARKNMNTRFIEIEASKAPFLVTKLGIKVLPCVVGYIKGQEKLRLVGFEQLGNTDDFSEQSLQFQLYKAGLVDRQGVTENKQSTVMGIPKKGVRGGTESESDSE